MNLPNPVRLAFLAALTVLAACSSNPIGQTARVEGPATPSELDLFAKHAVEDRVAAGDLPDMAMLSGAKRIAIRREMPLAGLELGAAGRPEVEGLELDLVARVALQEESDRMGVEVFYVSVDRPEIAGDTATILLGTGLAVPKGSDPYLCCCTGEARFRRTETGWMFEEWVSEWCR